MTRELLNAFWNLRKCERERILKNMALNIPHHVGETGLDFCTRAVRQICHDGRVRELEDEMRAYQ